MTRRELLSSLVGMPVGAALLSCERRPAAPKLQGRLGGPDMAMGHALRDGQLPSDEAFQNAPIERCAVAILGGGPAGLCAAWHLQRRGITDFLVLEMEKQPGGTSLSGSSEITPYPWGAHYLPVPMPHNGDLIALLREMGALVGTGADGMPEGAEENLVRDPAERIFQGGFWQEGLYPIVGSSAEDRRQLAAFQRRIDRYSDLRDAQGRRAFAIPISSSSDDPDLLALDRITARTWMDREGFTSPRLRWFVEYGCRDDYGLTLETASAWAAIWYFASRTPKAGSAAMPLLTWPEGNGALVTHLRRTVGARLRTERMVIDVVPENGSVRIGSLDAANRSPRTIIADRAIVCMPRFIAARVVRPLRDAASKADADFNYGAWLVANLHLSGRPLGRGHPPCWDNVLYDSPSLGYVSATHQRGRDFGPTVWTYYLPMTDADARAGQRKLLEPSWDDWKELIVHDLKRAHPDLETHLRRLDIHRWGHGMIQPRPGFISGRARRRAALPIDGIHFAHSDLSGVALFEEAFHQGIRAADEVFDALHPSNQTTVTTRAKTI